LAIDLFEATTNKEFLSKPNLKKYFDWLNENAYKYGFANTYQK
jgi:LAS superfamily LD-carboxypeptidase LdcB